MAEVWETARAIWENTPNISYAELIERLKELFGDEAPSSKSTIFHRIKKEKWTKKGPLKNDFPSNGRGKKSNESSKNQKKSNSKKAINNNELNARTLIEHRTIKEKIHQEYEKLVLDAEQKKQIIFKHRRRLLQLGEMLDGTIAVVNHLHGLDPEVDGEKIQRLIVISEVLSRTTNQLTASQKVIAEQEFTISGITVDDLKQSEQEKRMEGLKLLEGIEEEERAFREQSKLTLMQRLHEFEHMQLNNLDNGLVDEIDD